MAFPRQNSRVPTTVGPIQITLYDNDGTQGNASSTFQFTVFDAEGQPMKTVNGNLADHTTNAQKTTIWNFLQAMRTKATAEVL